MADVVLPGPVSIEADNPNGAKAMDPQDYGLLKMHSHNGAQGQADGARLYAENLRYDYLEGKHMASFTEALGARYIQGPHPQYGTPDSKA